MGTKMRPSYADLFVGFIEHRCFGQYNGPKPELYGRYIDDCIGVISFPPAAKYIWEFQLKATVYALVSTTNLQINKVTCCIHLRINHT